MIKSYFELSLNSLKKNWKVFIILTLFATIAVFLVSPDSYTHDLYQRNNSAWFFMCGKAWMNGMTPYVDFSDSKGPLLWLIYGIGYLLSHYNYVGVMWITCVFYAVTYLFAYKTAFIFLKDKRQSLLSAVLMTLFFFNAIYHREIKTEDFAQPFMMGAIYYTSCLLYGEPVARHRWVIAKAMLWLGLCFGATFLMKYNIAAISLVFAVYSLVAVKRDGYNLWKAFGLYVAGVAVVWVPFLVYFLVAGNLGAFCFEYFVNVFHTVGALGTSGNGVFDGIFNKFITNAFPITMQCIATLAPMVVIYMKRYRSFPFVAFLVSAVVNMGNGTLIYYFNNSNGLIIFGVIALVLLVRSYEHHRWPRYGAAVISVFILFLIVINNNDRGGNYFTQNGIRRSIFYYYATIMDQVPNPTIIYYRCMPNPEFGVCNNALPGCKYWALQSGATQAMKQEQDDAIAKKQVDFIAVGCNNITAINKVTKLGYYPYRHTAPDNAFVLFSKKKLKAPSYTINVPNHVVFLKKHFTTRLAFSCDTVPTWY